VNGASIESFVIPGRNKMTVVVSAATEQSPA